MPSEPGLDRHLYYLLIPAQLSGGQFIKMHLEILGPDLRRCLFLLLLRVPGEARLRRLPLYLFSSPAWLPLKCHSPELRQLLEGRRVRLLQLGTLIRREESPGTSRANSNSNDNVVIAPLYQMVSMFHLLGKQLFFPRGVVANQLEKM